MANESDKKAWWLVALGLGGVVPFIAITIVAVSDDESDTEAPADTPARHSDDPSPESPVPRPARAPESAAVARTAAPSAARNEANAAGGSPGSEVTDAGAAADSERHPGAPRPGDPPDRTPGASDCLDGAHDSCHRAGGAYRFGQSGAEKNPDKARYYFEQGCDGDNAISCRQLAFMAERGEGEAKDPDRAQEYFARAFDLDETDCEDGDRLACARLSDSYRQGRGVDVDPAKANALLRKIASMPPDPD